MVSNIRSGAIQAQKMTGSLILVVPCEMQKQELSRSDYWSVYSPRQLRLTCREMISKIGAIIDSGTYIHIDYDANGRPVGFQLLDKCGLPDGMYHTI